ncbi:MAG: class I SAM-dependent RNA methyltransferase [Nitrospira sp.]|nr:class I SAM-dependent RNA methyltransferase [Nitrospira sp.]
MYEYQLKKNYFAQLAEGLQEPVMKELGELGAKDMRPEHRGLHFSADPAALYRINYSARLISRVLAPLVSFQCSTTDELYAHAVKINWAEIISAENTFAILSNVSDSGITNSQFASLRLKDAVVDSIRTALGSRPNIDPEDPDVWLNLHIRKDRATISLDTSGGSMHKRGYRKASVSAPMQETVAAAALEMSGWEGNVPLYDPMCGSGTLLCEALMRYCRISPGVFRRRFGFENLPDFNGQLWDRVRKDSDSNIRELPPGLIFGSDISPQTVKIAGTNLKALQYGERVSLEVRDFRALDALKPGIVITNPPYGIRMGQNEDLEVFYKELGDFLKQKCKGSTAYIYFGEREFIKKIRLKSTWKKPLKTGGLDGRLVRYDMF